MMRRGASVPANGVVDASLFIREFRATDQKLVRELVLDGLRERWGQLDEGLNSDLEDIGSTYGSGLTLTAWSDSRLVATGTLAMRGSDQAEVLRMSTDREFRGRGIASRILRELLAEASRRGVSSVVLETAAAWADARALYERHGFVLDREVEGEYCLDAFYSLSLDKQPQR